MFEILIGDRTKKIVFLSISIKKQGGENKISHDLNEKGTRITRGISYKKYNILETSLARNRVELVSN